MALIDFHIHITADLDSVNKTLDHLLKHQHEIMATLAELTAKVTELQAAVDTEQQEIADALAALQAEVQRLTDIISAGGGATAEELQVVVDTINGIISDVQSTIPGLPPPTE